MLEIRRRLASAAIAIIIGISALMTVVSRPRFSEYRTVDVLELVTSGMCFGVALATLLRGRRNSGAP
jgi:hypothetical protein